MKYVTMQQFLQNPSGKYSAYFSRRDLIISNLEERYLKLMKDRKKDFKFNLYMENNDYYFIFKIPSETYDTVVFDVVIRFTPLTIDAKADYTLNRYAVNVFSNAPNFLFTYAYIYNQDDILVNFLKDKVGNIALTQAPKIKNPMESYGFEKSVYFALLFIKFNRYFNKSILSPYIQNKLDRKSLIKAIPSCHDKLQEYEKVKAQKSLVSKSKKKIIKTPKSNKPRKTSLLHEEIDIPLDIGPTSMGRKINRKVNMTHDMSSKATGNKKVSLKDNEKKHKRIKLM